MVFMISLSSCVCSMECWFIWFICSCVEGSSDKEVVVLEGKKADASGVDVGLGSGENWIGGRLLS